MNAALNSDVARLRVDLKESEEKRKHYEQDNTKLRIKLKDAEILSIKLDDEI